MAKAQFEKFINKPVKGAKIKEAIRQEKKAAVRERRDAIEKHFEDKRKQKAERNAQEGSNENRSFKGEGKKPYGAKPARPYQKKGAASASERAAKADDKSAKPAFKKTYGKDTGNKTPRPARKLEGKAGRPDYKKNNDRPAGEEKKTEGKSDLINRRLAQKADKPDFKKPIDKKGEGAAKPGTKFWDKDVKTSFKKTIDRKKAAAEGEGVTEERSARPAHKRPYEKKPIVAKANQSSKPAPAPRPKAAKTDPNNITDEDMNWAENRGSKDARKAGQKPGKPADKKKVNPASKIPGPEENGKEAEMPLNKYIAHAGMCSRRDAVEVVRKGIVTVDGVKILDPGFKVPEGADVKVEGQKIQRSRNQVYILMNKPKDFITTSDDPQGRKTVMDLIKNATTERVYPVGRLDRNTSGVLLFTNDGDLAQKLSHPSFEVRKIYEVKLDKILTKDDFEKILDGVNLEDGVVHADSLAYADKDKSVVGIEIHSGKNRVVRRIFEHLGYDVRALDRVMYANLTKKNVERGKWRFLNDKEVRLLKYFNKSKQK